ncbi:hypothetical protein Tco_0916800 [Tanacetum coccineum]
MNNITQRIGNGTSTTMWFDNWISLGPLCSIVSYRELYNARIPASSSVKDMMRNGNWNWPEECKMEESNLECSKYSQMILYSMAYSQLKNHDSR